MTDKVQKILNEITTRKLCTMDEHMAFYNDTAKEDYRFLSEIEELIKALQEEPVSDTQFSVILYGLTGSVGNTKEEPQVKESAEIERDKETCKENGNSLTQEPLNEDFEKEIERWAETFKHNPAAMGYKETAQHFAEWQKKQMMAKAIEGGCFSYKNGFVHISCDIDEHLTDIKIGDKVKVIVIKED